MTTKARFDKTLLEVFARARALGVRAGAVHKYTTIWVVVIENRVFARSWNDAEEGWFRAFRNRPAGSARLGKSEVGVSVRFTRSERLRKAVSRAFAEKYSAKGSQKWVRGFAEPGRERNTVEFLPEPRRSRPEA